MYHDALCGRCGLRGLFQRDCTQTNATVRCGGTPTDTGNLFGCLFEGREECRRLKFLQISLIPLLLAIFDNISGIFVGAQCWCGDRAELKETNREPEADKCTFYKCIGNKTADCGGIGFLMSVYEYKSRVPYFLFFRKVARGRLF